MESVYIILFLALIISCVLGLLTIKLMRRSQNRRLLQGVNNLEIRKNNLESLPVMVELSKIEDIENTIGEKIYWKIPNNYFSIMEAINKGIPVSAVNSSSNIANCFRDLASTISEDIIGQIISDYRGGSK